MVTVEREYAIYRIYAPGSDNFRNYPNGDLYDSYSGANALRAAEKDLNYLIRNYPNVPYHHEIRVRVITRSDWEPFRKDDVFED